MVRCVCPGRPLRSGASACSVSCPNVKFELCSHSSTTLSCGAPWGGYPVVWGAAGRSCGQICGRCGHRADVWLLQAPRRMYLVATHPHTTEMSTGAIPAARQRPTGVSLSVGLGRVCAAQHVAHGEAAAALNHAFRGGSATWRLRARCFADVTRLQVPGAGVCGQHTSAANST